MAKLLFITSRFPYPLDKGDKLRVYFQLKHLSKDNEVHLVAVNNTRVPDRDIEALTPFCKSISTFILPFHKRVLQLFLSPFKKLPLQVAYFFNKGIKKEIERLSDEIKPDHIHCHLIRTTEYVKDIKNVHKSLDLMDAFGRGMEKRQGIERNFFKRTLYGYEKEQLYRYEAEVFNFIDTFCIISNQDKSWIPGPRAGEIMVVPNGVDFDAFYPRREEKKYDLVFMGNLDYPPNIAAIFFLCDEIMPLLKKQVPNIKLLIAGAGASERIRKFRSENIDVIGEFRHISDSIAVSKIMIAPMKIHIGLPNKVIQAMAMKVPCIVSSMSNNAIGAQHNKSIIEANTATEFTNQIVALLNDERLATSIGEAAYEFVKENYSWEKQNELFKQLIQKQN